MTHKHEILPVILGTITSLSIGSLLFQALGTIVLGILGGLGGYIFIRFIKPRLDALFSKKDENKLNKLE